MAYTATTIVGKRLEARLEPWLDPAGDLARKCDAVGVMFQSMLEVAEETGEDGTAGYIPAYGKLLDPVTCPAADLPYLGQYVGVTVPTGATEAEARALVKAEAGLERGTRKAIEAAIKRVLGVAPFTIQERTAKGGGAAPYHFNVLVGIGKSSAALIAAIEEQKPGGLQFSVIETAGAWIAGSKKWSEVAATKKWSAIVEGEY